MVIDNRRPCLATVTREIGKSTRACDIYVYVELKLRDTIVRALCVQPYVFVINFNLDQI